MPLKQRTNDALTLHKWMVRPERLIYTVEIFNIFIHNKHSCSIMRNNTQMCFNRQNMHILFHEQAVYERGTRPKSYLMKWTVQ